MKRLGQRVRRDFEAAVALREPDQIPVAIWGGAPFVNSFAGIRARDYFEDPAMKIKATKMVQETFPEAIMLPGFYAYFGTTVEASALGCEIVWHDDAPPWVKPALTSIREVDRIGPVNPFKDGLMPRVLSQYRYMWDHLDNHYIEDYGYLDGVAHCMGPLQVASMVRGHTELFIDFYDAPELVHKLLRIITQVLVDWLHAVESVNGRLKRLCLADHIPAQISSEQFEEFCFPYLKAVYDEFPQAIKLYHNEDDVDHILSRIPDTGANIFHFGDLDLTRVKKTIGDRICLMGNVHPVDTMLRGTLAEVATDAHRCIQELSPGGGFILSTGGGMAPGTKRENIDALLQAARG